MTVEAKLGRIGGRKGATVVIGLFEEELLKEDSSPVLDVKLRKYISEILKLGDFTGKKNSLSVLYPSGAVPPARIFLVGLGARSDFSLEVARQAAGTAVKTALDCGVSDLTTLVHGLDLPGFTPEACAQATVEGAILGGYRHTEFKSDDSDVPNCLEALTVMSSQRASASAVKVGAETGRIVAEGAILARDLSNAPGNALTPRVLADTVRKMAHAKGITCNILDKKEIEKLKMGALLAVSQGSREPPRFIILEHGKSSKKKETLVLVGKGITFDSGGISLKPGAGMEDMKHDMSGAAAVAGAMQAIGELKPSLHVVGLIPASENLPDGKALKPGDVITAMSGKTIEIINTDAEGRLVLADALAYAARYNPAAVIDLATLTGACVIALGHAASGLMVNDVALADKVRKAGETTGERVWHLPVWKEHHDQIKGKTGDIKNTGGRAAGSLTAAAFLENFVDYPWAHLDIAGTAYSAKASPYRPAGATGEGARLLVQFVRDWEAKGIPSNG